MEAPIMPRHTLVLLALMLTAGCGSRDTTGPTPAVAGARSRIDSRTARHERQESSLPRAGELRVTKECSQYSRLAGGFCTITSSSLAQIPVGTLVVYASDAAGGFIDSDVTLEPPGPGSSRASGHCRLELATGNGLCTFSGGTGTFTHFSGSVVVTRPERPNFLWSGTYSFDPRD
jgi:hypothetical protein